jgi:predicted DNA-binding transcriptional regulator
MPRVLVVLAVATLAVMIYALVDMILIEASRVRGVNKVAWAFIIVLLPLLGALLWFTLGRGRNRPRPATRTIAPDDDPNFLERINRESDERIRRLEQELAELDDDPPAKD